jgi:hypothetical protein
LEVRGKVNKWRVHNTHIEDQAGKYEMTTSNDISSPVLGDEDFTQHIEAQEGVAN